ncbi:hypothetical protein ACFLX7_05515, partial [Chloroflexota bacterium]
VEKEKGKLILKESYVNKRKTSYCGFGRRVGINISSARSNRAYISHFNLGHHYDWFLGGFRFSCQSLGNQERKIGNLDND